MAGPCWACMGLGYPMGAWLGTPAYKCCFLTHPGRAEIHQPHPPQNLIFPNLRAPTKPSAFALKTFTSYTAPMQNQNPTNTPTVWLPNDAQLQELDAQHDALLADIARYHIFTDLPWESEVEPLPNQMCHLMTVTGLLLIAPYPADHELNTPYSHYVAWAPLSDEPTLTLH